MQEGHLDAVAWMPDSILYRELALLQALPKAKRMKLPFLTLSIEIPIDGEKIKVSFLVDFLGLCRFPSLF